MWGLPTESQAIRRELGVGCLAFVVGFLAAGAAVIYLHVRYVIPEDGLWGIAGCIRILLEYPLLAGLGLAWATFALLNRRHHRLGVYHCARCGRPLQHRRPCVCLPEEIHRSRRRDSKWRRYRRRIVRVFAIYAMFVPIAYALAVLVTHPYHTFLVAFVAAHWALCMVVFIALELSANTAEMFGRGKRFRKCWAVSKPVFGAYPLMLALTVTIVEIIKTASS
jgi:hypothetical protein